MLLHRNGYWNGLNFQNSGIIILPAIISAEFQVTAWWELPGIQLNELKTKVVCTYSLCFSVAEASYKVIARGPAGPIIVCQYCGNVLTKYRDPGKAKSNRRDKGGF